MKNNARKIQNKTPSIINLPLPITKRADRPTAVPLAVVVLDGPGPTPFLFLATPAPSLALRGSGV